MSERVRSTGAYVVFDASVFVAAAARLETPALEWIRRAMRRDVVVAVPDLVFAEVGNALWRYVSTATLTLSGALGRMRVMRRMPLEVRAMEDLIEPAVGVGVSRGLTVYDACYVVLAEAEGAVLVTADAGLAAAVSHAELI
jgi:predicted nucleic acid-binding protein